MLLREATHGVLRRVDEAADWLEDPCLPEPLSALALDARGVPKFTPAVPHEVLAGRDESVQEAADSLRRNGLVVLRRRPPERRQRRGWCCVAAADAGRGGGSYSGGEGEGRGDGKIDDGGGDALDEHCLTHGRPPGEEGEEEEEEGLEHLVPRSLCARGRERVERDLDELLALAALQYNIRDPLVDELEFQEIQTRAKWSRRFDLNYNPELNRNLKGGLEGGLEASLEGDGTGPGNTEAAASDAIVADIVREVTRVLAPVLRRVAEDEMATKDPRETKAMNLACCDRPQLVGCVTSVPGAPHQHWHADGMDEGLMTVFCPLVDVNSRNGPTELRPGSHLASRRNAELNHLNRSWLGTRLQSGDPRVATVKAELDAGEILAFD